MQMESENGLEQEGSCRGENLQLNLYEFCDHLRYRGKDPRKISFLSRWEEMIMHLERNQ